MRRYLVRFLKLASICLVTVVLTVFLNKILQVLLPVYDGDNVSDSPVAAAFKHVGDKSGNLESDLPKKGDNFVKHPKNIGPKKIDWNDNDFQAAERTRTGIGENGVAATVQANQEEARKIQYDEHGFDGHLSDMIALNRSVRDTRHKE